MPKIVLRLKLNVERRKRIASEESSRRTIRRPDLLACLLLCFLRLIRSLLTWPARPAIPGVPSGNLMSLKKAVNPSLKRMKVTLQRKMLTRSKRRRKMRRSLMRRKMRKSLMRRKMKRKTKRRMIRKMIRSLMRSRRMARSLSLMP